MIKLDKYEQQIIFACKSWGEWAKREDRYKAVRVVVGQYYAIDEEELGIYTTYSCLLELFLTINKEKPYALKNFMENLFKDFSKGGYKTEINMEHIVRNFISFISEIPVIDNKGNDLFVELEKDYDILNYGIKEIN